MLHYYSDDHIRVGKQPNKHAAAAASGAAAAAAAEVFRGNSRCMNWKISHCVRFWWYFGLKINKTTPILVIDTQNRSELLQNSDPSLQQLRIGFFNDFLGIFIKILGKIKGICSQKRAHLAAAAAQPTQRAAQPAAALWKPRCLPTLVSRIKSFLFVFSNLSFVILQLKNSQNESKNLKMSILK